MPCRAARPGARLDEAAVAGRDRNGEAGRDRAPLARPEHDVLDAREVEPGVARIRARRHLRVGVKAADEQFGHTR